MIFRIEFSSKFRSRFVGILDIACKIIWLITYKFLEIYHLTIIRNLSINICLILKEMFMLFCLFKRSEHWKLFCVKKNLFNKTYIPCVKQVFVMYLNFLTLFFTDNLKNRFRKLYVSFHNIIEYWSISFKVWNYLVCWLEGQINNKKINLSWLRKTVYDCHYIYLYITL